MSDRIEGFRGRSIEDVQRRLFLGELLSRGGTFGYGSSGLNAPAGTVILFQFKARIVASGVFLRDEWFDEPRRGRAGVLHVEPASVRTFDPVDVEAMRLAWPGFRGFGHVKQRLNPAGYASFKRRLKSVRSSTA